METWKHRITEIGGNLWRSSRGSPMLCSKQSNRSLIAYGNARSNFECLQGWRLNASLGNLFFVQSTNDEEVLLFFFFYMNSSVSTSCLSWGAQNWTKHSSPKLRRGKESPPLNLLAMLFLTQPRNLTACLLCCKGALLTDAQLLIHPHP